MDNDSAEQKVPQSTEETMTNDMVAQAKQHLSALGDLTSAFLDTPDKDHCQEIFTHYHALKGLAAFFGFKALEASTQAISQLLDDVNKDQIALDAGLSQTIQKAYETIKEAFTYVEAHGEEAPETDESLIGAIESLRGAQQTVSSQGKDSATIPLGDGEQTEAVAETEDEQPTPSPQPSASPDRQSIDKPHPTTSHQQLDDLLTLTNRLAMVRNQLLNYVEKRKDGNFPTLCQTLDKVTAELQKHVVHLRERPLEMLWSKCVTEAMAQAEAQAKTVEFHFNAPAITVDQAWLDTIQPLFCRCLCYIVEHNIPSSGEDNPDAGKRIDISCTFQAHQLTFCLKAEHAYQDQDLSTIETLFSMVNGKIALRLSHQFNVLLVILPLVPPVIDGTIIKQNNQKFVIPTHHVLKALELAHDDIEEIYNAMVYRLDSQLLPIVPLKQLLFPQTSKAADHSPLKQLAQQSTLSVMVLQTVQGRFGLIVDEVIGKQEITVQALPEQVKKIELYLGVTVLDKKNIMLILDPMVLANMAKIKSESNTQTDDDGLITA